MFPASDSETRSKKPRSTALSVEWPSYLTLVPNPRQDDGQRQDGGQPDIYIKFTLLATSFEQLNRFKLFFSIHIMFLTYLTSEQDDGKRQDGGQLYLDRYFYDHFIHFCHSSGPQRFKNSNDLFLSSKLSFFIY